MRCWASCGGTTPTASSPPCSRRPGSAPRCSRCMPSTTNWRAPARSRASPALALIRLQWWREVVEGVRRRHEVATPLGAALDAGRAARTRPAGHDRGARGRGRTVGRRPGRPGRRICRAPPGCWRWRPGGRSAPGRRCCRACPASAPPMAWRAVAQRGGSGRQGRCLLPDDMLAAHGLSAHDVMAKPDAPSVRPVLLELAAGGASAFARAPASCPARCWPPGCRPCWRGATFASLARSRGRVDWLTGWLCWLPRPSAGFDVARRLIPAYAGRAALKSHRVRGLHNRMPSV